MSFVSCSADNIKKWQCRDGRYECVIDIISKSYYIFNLFYENRFLKNFSGHNSVVNCLAVNEEGVTVSCGDNGTMCFWDYDTGYCFQQTQTIAQSGI